MSQRYPERSSLAQRNGNNRVSFFFAPEPFVRPRVRRRIPRWMRNTVLIGSVIVIVCCVVFVICAGLHLEQAH